MKRPHASRIKVTFTNLDVMADNSGQRPAKPQNYWIGLLGLIAMALVAVAFLWALMALLLVWA